jgi:hypothetical protein
MRSAIDAKFLTSAFKHKNENSLLLRKRKSNECHAPPREKNGQKMHKEKPKSRRSK